MKNSCGKLWSKRRECKSNRALHMEIKDIKADPLRKLLTGLLGPKSRGRNFYLNQENCPSFWKKTGIPFISLNHPPEGVKRLGMKEMRVLYSSAKEERQSLVSTPTSTSEAENQNSTEEVRTPRVAGANLTNRKISTMGKRKMIRIPRNGARRELFPVEEVGMEDLNVDEDEYNVMTDPKLTDKEKVLHVCGQREPVRFEDLLYTDYRKIGEGIFGEVFKVVNPQKDESVIKIIPIEGNFKVNNESQRRCREILPEMIIAKELGSLAEHFEGEKTSSFCPVHKISCVLGKYPTHILSAWDRYNAEKTSDNDRPDMFPANQLYIIIESPDCGTPLEMFKFTRVEEGISIYAQIALALAVAEAAVQFEHRDLHWGNILVKRTIQDTMHFKIDGRNITVPTEGVTATVIDYSLSRITKGNISLFTDISCDEELFEGEGDEQFDVYRKMRNLNGNEWEHFEPRSNVLWLAYILNKIIAKPYASKSGKKEKMTRLKNLISSLENSKTCSEVVQKIPSVSIL